MSSRKRGLRENVSFGQSPLTGLFVERWQVVARLFHYLHHSIERYSVNAICEGRIYIRVERTSCCQGVSFDAWNLHQSTNRITSHPQVMLQPHLCRVLNLCRASPEQLACRCGSHGTRHAHLSLATHFGSRDRRVFLHDITHQAGRGQCPKDPVPTELAALLQMV